MLTTLAKYHEVLGPHTYSVVHGELSGLAVKKQPLPLAQQYLQTPHPPSDELTGLHSNRPCSSRSRLPLRNVLHGETNVQKVYSAVSLGPKRRAGGGAKLCMLRFTFQPQISQVFLLSGEECDLRREVRSVRLINIPQEEEA